MNYASELKFKKRKIAVWGCGFIGLSTALHYANKGIRVVGFDIDQQVVNSLKNKKIHIHNIESWMGFSIERIIKSKLIHFTNEIEDILSDENIICHFISVPTEKKGKPFLKPIKWVLDKISKNDFKNKNKNKNKKQCIIIESTLVPKTTDTFLKKIFLKNKSNINNFHYCVAPRRDWFETKDKTLNTLTRVFGCNNEDAKKQIYKILNIVTKSLNPASSYRVSEFVKAFENSYRHLEITLANQLSFAFPNDNVREALKLAGTKWNMNTYYPGFGTGGYCIPLSSHYVIQGAGSNKKYLSLLRHTIKFDQNVNKLIAKKIILKKYKKILILGLSYKSDVKVSILSPSIELFDYLKSKNLKVDIFDPLFTSKDLNNILNYKLPKNLNLRSIDNYDCIILMVKHKYFEEKIKIELEKIKKVKMIIDNTSLLKKYEKIIHKKNCRLVITGEQNWLL